MDAPLWCHYRKLVLWFTLEGILIALSIVARTDHVRRLLAAELSTPCRGRQSVLVVHRLA